MDSKEKDCLNPSNREKQHCSNRRISEAPKGVSIPQIGKNSQNELVQESGVRIVSIPQIGKNSPFGLSAMVPPKQYQSLKQGKIACIVGINEKGEEVYQSLKQGKIVVTILILLRPVIQYQSLKQGKIGVQCTTALRACQESQSLKQGKIEA